MRKFVCQVTFEIPEEEALLLEQELEDNGEEISLEELLNLDGMIALQSCSGYTRDLEQYFNHKPDFVRKVE